MALELVEGWTERISYSLAADGVAQPLSGITVDLILYDGRGSRVSYSGSTGVSDAVNGVVYFDPAASDIVAGNYSLRWKLTDGSGKVAFYPNRHLETWIVRKP